MIILVLGAIFVLIGLLEFKKGLRKSGHKLMGRRKRGGLSR